MTTLLALLMVTFIDLPTIISIIGALKVKRWWKLPFVIFFAAFFKEVFDAIFSIFYEPFQLLPITLIVQTFVAVMVFRTAQSIRKRYPDPKQARKHIILYGATLFTLFAVLASGVIYLSMQKKGSAPSTPQERGLM